MFLLKWKKTSVPVILMNKFSVNPEEFDIFMKERQQRPRNLRSSQGSSQHNYTRVSVEASRPLTMQFGNLLRASRKQLVLLWTRRTDVCISTKYCGILESA
jgi:hypothetical protein